MKSIFKIGFTTRIPTTYATIPFGLGANGCPFLFENGGTVSEFKVVNYRTKEEFDLSTTIIQQDLTKNALFYNASHNLGVTCGDYYYKLRVDGSQSGGEDSIIFTSESQSSAFYSSALGYGEWDFDVYYKLADVISNTNINFSFIASSSLTGIYNIAINNDYIEFSRAMQYEPPIGTPLVSIFKTENNIVTVDGRIKITAKRNETINQFFTGDADAFAFYINDVLIDDSTAITGTNPIVDSTYTTTGRIIVGGSKDMEIFNTPSNYTVISGSIEDKTNPIIYSGGSTYYSQIFHVEDNMRLPDPQVGDYNQDYNDDYNNFESTGILDENGEPIS